MFVVFLLTFVAFVQGQQSFHIDDLLPSIKAKACLYDASLSVGPPMKRPTCPLVITKEDQAIRVVIGMWSTDMTEDVISGCQCSFHIVTRTCSTNFFGAKDKNENWKAVIPEPDQCRRACQSDELHTEPKVPKWECSWMRTSTSVENTYVGSKILVKHTRSSPSVFVSGSSTNCSLTDGSCVTEGKRIVWPPAETQGVPCPFVRFRSELCIASPVPDEQVVSLTISCPSTGMFLSFVQQEEHKDILKCNGMHGYFSTSGKLVTIHRPKTEFTGSDAEDLRKSGFLISKIDDTIKEGNVDYAAVSVWENYATESLSAEYSNFIGKQISDLSTETLHSLHYALCKERQLKWDLLMSDRAASSRLAPIPFVDSEDSKVYLGVARTVTVRCVPAKMVRYVGEEKKCQMMQVEYLVGGHRREGGFDWTNSEIHDGCKESQIKGNQSFYVYLNSSHIALVKGVMAVVDTVEAWQEKIHFSAIPTPDRYDWSATPARRRKLSGSGLEMEHLQDWTRHRTTREDFVVVTGDVVRSDINASVPDLGAALRSIAGWIESKAYEIAVVLVVLVTALSVFAAMWFCWVKRQPSVVVKTADHTTLLRNSS